MSIKFYHIAGATDTGANTPFAIGAPRPTDIISGTLCDAFASQDEQFDFDSLLARIDQAERASRTISPYLGRG